MPINPSKPRPPRALGPQELRLRILDPLLGAGSWVSRGSAFGNDSRFPVWFLSRGLWDRLTRIICVHMHISFLFVCFFFFPLLLFLLYGFWVFVVVVNWCDVAVEQVPSLLWKNVEKQRQEVGRGLEAV